MTPTKFEYKEFTGIDIKWLNKMGDEGWQVVAAQTYQPDLYQPPYFSGLLMREKTLQHQPDLM